MVSTVSLDVGDGRTLTIETGRLAKQANGAVLVRLGDTVVLVTAVMSKEVREGIDFFPLTCDYEERMYAAGKIPGSFPKREGKPSEKAVVTARLMDRPHRPLFPEGMRNDVQIIGIPLSVDPENPPDVLAMIGTSAALTISDIPFSGPVGSVRVALVDGQFVAYPTQSQLDASDLDLLVAGTRDAVTTIDVAASQVTEAEILEAIEFAQKEILRLCDLQEQLAEQVGKPKSEVTIIKPDEELVSIITQTAGEKIANAIVDPDKASRETAITELIDEIVADLLPEYPEREADIRLAADKVVKQEVRKLILDHGIRPDGRKADEIRPVTCEVGVLPRAHGSGLFTRGQTQVLTVCTLGSLDEEQILDSLTGEATKRFMHHYNFPPFCVGEAKPIRGASRRDIGHGALAERALRCMIPEADDFPYVIRLVSEVLESNGSSSMASVCGSSLALMDAGVQITAPVAGIAIGLMTDGDRYCLLTDIQGMEDFGGDMDFKVAGSETGITAIQLDTKIPGITLPIIRDALERAREARLQILDKMRAVIPAPRETLSPYAPRIFVIEIHPDKIGDVIGPGGKIVKKIQAETGARIDIEQDGKVYIASVGAEGGERAKKWIEDLAKEVKVGEVYPGRVTRLVNFGAFVEILPGKEGLVPISQLSSGGRARRIEDLVKVGDEIVVRVTDIDSQGRINLARKDIQTPPHLAQPRDKSDRKHEPPRKPQQGQEKHDKDRDRQRGPSKPQQREEPPVGITFRPKPKPQDGTGKK
ncbi:MAG: polyribonucleotide nucleotidyltransferase [Armatimonadota bacterium]